MPVLGIDTATAHGSIALAGPGGVLVEVELAERNAHARNLLTRVQGAIRDSGLKIGDLSGIAVAVGPGSFTGIRVGMATAKGLAYSLRIGLAGLSTIEALARTAYGLEATQLPDILCPVLEAGRGEVYAATFRPGTKGPVRCTPDRSWHPGELAETLPDSAVLVGDGAPLVLSAECGRTSPLRVVKGWPLIGAAIALWGCEALPPGTTYTPGALGPNYIRPSDAKPARRKT